MIHSSNSSPKIFVLTAAPGIKSGFFPCRLNFLVIVWIFGSVCSHASK